MSNPTGNHCIIVVEDLFNKINTQRKLLKRAPIENRAMASRCTLRFNVDKQRGVDFSAEKVLIARDELVLLEKIVNELFGVYFENELSRLCAKPAVPAAKPTRPAPPLPSIAMENVQPEKTGFISKLKALFGG